MCKACWVVVRAGWMWSTHWAWRWPCHNMRAGYPSNLKGSVRVGQADQTRYSKLGPRSGMLCAVSIHPAYHLRVVSGRSGR